MKLNKLKINNFRNLVNQELNFSKKITIFTGRNGQGKTSLLEAIYILSQSKSFRSNKFKELINWNIKNDCLVEGNVETEDGSKVLIYKVTSSKRSLFINKTKLESAIEFIGNLKTVEFIPEDLILISGAPSERRKFFDRLISQINSSYLKNLINYNRAIKQRNNLLSKNVSYEEIKSWDLILVNLLIKISKERKEKVLAFSKLFKESYKYFSCFKDESELKKLYGENISNNELVNLEYSSSLLNDSSDILSEEEIAEKYKSSFELDSFRKSTSFGTHRDDFLISLSFEDNNFRLAKNLASQGQKRSLALALKFASVKFIEEETRELPLLLIDDVESELDSIRREALVSKISEVSNQVILTTTEIDKIMPENNSLKEGLDYEIIAIENGKII